MSDFAIRVQDVTKLYKLYDKPSDRFKESLGLSKKIKYREHYALHNLNFDVQKVSALESLERMGLVNQQFSRLLQVF